jgi:hypothetical protein
MSPETGKPRLKRPDKPIYDADQDCWTYNGQRFFPTHTDLNVEQTVELQYLRDLTRFYEQELRGCDALERSIHEALNTGDGSYRP